MDQDSRSFSFFTWVGWLSIALFGIASAKEALVPILLAALLAFLMNPGMRFFMRCGLPEATSLVLVVLFFIAPLILMSYELFLQTELLFRALPELTVSLQQRWQQILIGSSHYGLRDALQLDSLGERLASEMGTSLAFLAGSVRACLSFGGEMTIIFIFAIVMLMTRVRLRLSSVWILRDHTRVTIDPDQFVTSIVDLIERFLLVRMGIMLVVGTIDWALLQTFGVPYALFGGILCGLLTLVPAVGFFISMVPVGIFAGSAGLASGTFFLLFLALASVSLLEAHIVGPKLLGKHLKLNLLVIFLGIFLGERIWGGWGMFLSVPLLGILRIVLDANPRLAAFGSLLQ